MRATIDTLTKRRILEAREIAMATGNRRLLACCEWVLLPAADDCGWTEPDVKQVIVDAWNESHGIAVTP